MLAHVSWMLALLFLLFELQAVGGSGNVTQGVGSRRPLPRLLRPIATPNRRALVMMLHRALECELDRFARLVRTRPPDADVVVLYDDHKWRQSVTALGRSLLEAVDVAVDGGPPPFHFVPYKSGSAEQHLIALGYRTEPIRRFSPGTSAFSKVAFFVWGARQSYEEIWLIESDVFVPCSWEKLLAPWPMPASPRGDRMIVSSCGMYGAHWIANAGRHATCNFCHYNDPGELAREHCLLSLSAFTRGLLVETDAVLKRGEAHGHHEAFLPAVCRNMSAAGRPCELQEIVRDRQIDSSIGYRLTELPRTAQKRMLKAKRLEIVAVEEAAASNRSMSQGRAGEALEASCGREHPIVFHPIKCKGGRTVVNRRLRQLSLTY
jgi:hypothetical protein